MSTPGGVVALRGAELPQLGRRRIDAISQHGAVALTAGAEPKGYHYTDPNEDVVALVEREGQAMLVCADGHNGAVASRVAVHGVLDRLRLPVAESELTDDALIDLWCAVNDHVRAAGRRGGQPESRTTLILAVLIGTSLRWAAMGDSVLAVIRGDAVEILTRPASHFVGWPMQRSEIAERLARGSADLRGPAWVVAATDGLADFAAHLPDALVDATAGDPPASAVADQLITAACRGGAGDNVGVVAVRVTGPRAPASGRVEDRVRGCLLGGAVGDALGAAIEFDSLERIRARYGPAGVTGYEPAYGRRGAITDDTQMTLFTADGLLRAHIRGELKGVCHPPSVVDHAYARWLGTQGETSPLWDRKQFDGWLWAVEGLHTRRAPGNTCLSALRARGVGSVESPLNTSKGCGGVMRAAPAGLRDCPRIRFVGRSYVNRG